MEEILARCLSDLERGASVEDCLARYPEWRDELQPLLQAAQRMSAAPRVAPSVSFQQSARSRLMCKIDARAPAKEQPGQAKGQGILSRLGLRPNVPVLVRRLATPGLAAIAILVLLGTLGIGAVYASSDSLPGDTLYGVKLAGERAQLALSPKETTDAHLYLRFAQERLQEAMRLTEMGRADEVETTVNSYVDALEAASDILQRQRVAGQDVASLTRTLRRQVAEHQATLSRIRERVGEETEAAVERAMIASRAAARRALEAPVEEPEAPPLDPPPTETATATPTQTDEPTATVAPTDTAEPSERGEPVDPGQPPGKTMTPQPPGQTMTPQPPGLTKTPQPPGQTVTPQPPGQTMTAQPPGRTMTPQPPGQTMTPQPPGQTVTPQPPGQTMTPQPLGRTMTPEPPGPPDLPVPPSSPGPPGGSKPGDAGAAASSALTGAPNP